MIRALVVDDETLAREALREILQEDGAFEIVRECKNGKEAVQAIQKEKLDVVFLDVRMPLLDGFEVVEQVGADKMPLTVFVTAYDSFAIKAFEAQALDYVLKPFDEERFRKTIERIKRQLRTRTEMLAGISHDLRTPLTRMKLELAMLTDREAARELENDVQQMEHMIGEYLDFVSAATWCPRQKRSRSARVNIVPARFDTAQHEHLVPERREWLQNG